MSSQEQLLRRWPHTPVVSVSHPVDVSTFNVQYRKHVGRQAEGGAIGVVWLDNDEVVLSERTALHPGWALLGGTVERGQSFDDAFIREVKEEAGLDVVINRILVLELAVFTAPGERELTMPLAVFEATAASGQRPQQTDEAVREGLTVHAFPLDRLPPHMILSDREKLEIIVSSR
jgi:ADP-ribose pyrophosphatase YjhB (NUDIX family)